MRRFATAACIAGLLVGSTASAAEPRLNFVTCPIARDTSDIVLCWTVEYKGETYFLGWQGNQYADWYSPMLKHQVVVEDAVVAQPERRVCGGKVLSKFWSSPVYDIDKSCDVVLPQVEEYKPPADYWDKLLAFGRAGAVTETTEGFFQHPRNPKPMVAPFSEQRLEVLYDFNWVSSRHRSVPDIERAADYAKAANWKVTILGKRGSTRLTDGGLLVEHEGLPERRALHVKSSLVALGLPADRIEVKWSDAPERPRDDEPWKTRHATLTVHP